MVVNPSITTKTVPEFIDYAKANPGKINFGSGGSGTTTHLSGVLLNMMAGINMVHVPYRGESLALTDMIGGQVQMMFPTATGSLEFIKAGKLRALAVTTSVRAEVLPDLPTVGDFVPGYEASGWAGLGAPKDTAPDTIEKLNREINRGLADSRIKTRLTGLGAVPMPMTPTEFGKFIVDETEKLGKVVKFAGIKPE
jgi:tripartite-type tricarboxylate transporter receptor subunit TctC